MGYLMENASKQRCVVAFRALLSVAKLVLRLLHKGHQGEASEMLEQAINEAEVPKEL